eukprot:2707003-Prymnesium_polylepis.2
MLKLGSTCAGWVRRAQAAREKGERRGKRACCEGARKATRDRVYARGVVRERARTAALAACCARCCIGVARRGRAGVEHGVYTWPAIPSSVRKVRMSRMMYGGVYMYQ